MSFLGSLVDAVEIGAAQAHGVAAAVAALKASDGNPLLATRAYCTAIGLGDAPAAELEAGLRWGVERLATATAIAADVVQVVGNLGYQLGHVRAVLQGWLAEAASPQA